MEEDDLANIAILLAKDILVDESNCIKLVDPLQPRQRISTSYPFLESDDEAFTFFLKQQNLLDPKKELSIEKVSHKRRLPCSHSNKINMEHGLKRRPPQTLETEALRRNPVLDLNLLNLFDTNSFENYLHMSKSTFLKVFKSLGHLLVPTRTAATTIVPPQTAFSLALYKLTTDEHFEEIARRFQIPLHTCHQVIRGFWHTMSENYESFIKWPNSLRSQQATLRDFQAIPELTSFDMLFGVIATKRLDIFLESEDEEISVVLQIICDAQEKVVDCFVEFAHEYAFDYTPIGQTLDLNAQTIPAGSYLIGDTSFPLRHFLIRPFEVDCFRQETIFNRMLLPALAMGQRVLDMMAQRFHTLYALEAKDISEVRKVVETVSSLHNLCIEHQDEYGSRIRQQAMAESGVGHQKLKSVTAKGSEKNQQGRETRLKLMERVVQLGK